MTARIPDFDDKPQVVATDRVELYDSESQTTKSATPATLVSSGLPVSASSVQVGEEMTLDGTSASRVTLQRGGSALLILDGGDVNNPWHAGPAADDFRIQRQFPDKPIYSKANDQDTGIGFPAADTVSVMGGGVEVCRFRNEPAGVNFAQVSPSATGQPVDIEPEGADVDISLRLRGKGTGKVQIGQVVAASDAAAFSPTHWIQLEDEDGTAYWIPATVNGPW